MDEMMYEIYHNYKNAYQQLLLISVVSRGDSRLLENYVLIQSISFCMYGGLEPESFFSEHILNRKKETFCGRNLFRKGMQANG